MMKYKLNAACTSSMGKIRKNNEDNLYFDRKILEMEHGNMIAPMCSSITRPSACFAIFDGMGGVADGELASYLAADCFREECLNIEGKGLMSESFFANAIAHMNNLVAAEAEAKRNGMGTTAVMLGFCGDQVYICNVGDSRAYRFRDGQLHKISVDHVSLLPPYLQNGKRKPPLSQCIGMQPEEIQLEPYIAQGSLQDGDIYLLCSDGLTDMVADREIAAILNKSADIRECTQTLHDTALLNGGKDNITVMLICVSK